MGVLKFGNKFWGGEIRALPAEFLLSSSVFEDMGPIKSATKRPEGR
jgi:hypothetical protein